MTRVVKVCPALLAAAAAVIVLSHGALAARPAPPVVGAQSAVLMDVGSGTVLFAQGEHLRRPVASTTKIMTALLAIESGRLQDTVVVSDGATKVQSSSLGLQPGERLPLDTLLTALLLKSANDAAVAIAEHLGGSVSGFSDMMNARARKLGANDTHFVNPNGLYDPDHYSSAYDLALIARAALRQPRFRELVRSKTAEIDRPDLGTAETLINHNRLLWRDDTVDGVKTGYVKESGHCLVASATRDDWQLIAVVLDSPDTYADTEALFNWGFAGFTCKVLANPGEALGAAPVTYGKARTVPAVCEFPLRAVAGDGLAPATLEVTYTPLPAPVKQGQRVGMAKVMMDGRVVDTSPVVAKEAVARSLTAVLLAWLLRIVGAVVALLALAVVIRICAKLARARRRRRDLVPSTRRPGVTPPGPRV